MTNAYAAATIHRTMADAENVKIMRAALGYNEKKPERSYFVAKDQKTLVRCHQLSDIGLLIFAPGPGMTTFFLVSHVGAKSMGAELQGEDARIASILEAVELDRTSAEWKWRSDLRHAQISGAPEPRHPGAAVPCTATEQRLPYVRVA